MILKGKTKLSKELPINKNSIFKKINYKNLDNCKPNTRNKKDFDNNNDNSNLINIYDNSKDYAILYKKINLKQLKLDIHKFEKYPKFLPNIESLNKIQPFQFVRKNYIKYNRFHFNTKVEININKKSFNNRKNSCDNINLKLKKNQNFLKLDNINIRLAMSAKRRSNNRILFKKNK